MHLHAEPELPRGKKIAAFFVTERVVLKFDIHEFGQPPPPHHRQQARPYPRGPPPLNDAETMAVEITGISRQCNAS